MCLRLFFSQNLAMTLSNSPVYTIRKLIRVFTITSHLIIQWCNSYCQFGIRYVWHQISCRNFQTLGALLHKGVYIVQEHRIVVVVHTVSAQSKHVSLLPVQRLSTTKGTAVPPCGRTWKVGTQSSSGPQRHALAYPHGSTCCSIPTAKGANDSR